MFKYLKYYLSTLLTILAIFFSSLGTHFPTYWFIVFSLFIILGDHYFPKDSSLKEYNYPLFINLPIYINLPLLLIYLSEVIFVLGNSNAQWIIQFFDNYLLIDLLYMKNNISLLDKISLIAVASLNIGMIGTVPGHELTHRKKNKFDMFFGNWLLSLSWDCAFALEHVYGHHKNVGLKSDPASAKRGENIYIFILRASIKEHIDAWKIEINHLKRRGFRPYGLDNKMLLGYFRSLTLTIYSFLIGGLIGMMFYLLSAIIAKCLLEAINYIEHYGLVREPNKPVQPKHSWNSNHLISSLILYNVTRHSAHHEKSNLKFWELEAYPNSPMLPYGYLTMLYICIFLPSLFHKIMQPLLSDWDIVHASKEERKIANPLNAS